jgi:hypothetical protein
MQAPQELFVREITNTTQTTAFTKAGFGHRLRELRGELKSDSKTGCNCFWTLVHLRGRAGKMIESHLRSNVAG